MPTGQANVLSIQPCWLAQQPHVMKMYTLWMHITKMAAHYQNVHYDHTWHLNPFLGRKEVNTSLVLTFLDFLNVFLSLIGAFGINADETM